jgi:hypothetical protein
MEQIAAQVRRRPKQQRRRVGLDPDSIVMRQPVSARRSTAYGLARDSRAERTSSTPTPATATSATTILSSHFRACFATGRT